MIKTTRLLLALLLAPSLAAAEQTDFTVPPGPYIAAGLGGDWIDRSPLTLFGRTVDSRWAAGWGGFAAIGLAHLSWGQNFRANLKSLPYVYDDSGSKFGWQAIVGVAFAVTDHLALTVDGRYKGSNGYSFRSSGPVSSDITNFDYKTRSLFAGARYSF